MAVREFHITFTNNATATPPGAPVSVGIVLKRTEEYRCHGIYTDDVAPPDTISPGQTVEWAAESSGAATGCEGRVKYDIVAADAAAQSQGKLCITWDNPYDFGVTHPDGQINNSVIPTNDCEIDRGTDKNPTIFVTNGFEFVVDFNGQNYSTGGAEFLLDAALFASPPFSFGGFGPSFGLFPQLLAGSGGIIPHAALTVTLQNTPGSFREHARRWNERGQAAGWRYDPGSGVRSIVKNVPEISLRRIMDPRRL
jgi:hypothetical protein